MKKIMQNKWEVITIILICGLALFLNMWRISVQGYANEYYTAGVTSMLQSWKNFFFVAYDPSGYISIDKPPLGLWLQAISAKLFGVSGFSVLLPEILGGVISVFLLYKILKKAVNWKIAALGALFLAITPIFVVTTRTNTPDMVMIPMLLWALLVTIVAIEKRKMRYLIGVGVIIGLAFNVKMLQAYMIVPAVYGAYFLFTNIGVWKRLRNIVISVIVMVSVSLSWAIAVDLTPKTERPYVGSTSSNSALELIFGWNGISRLTSTSNTPGGSGEKPEESESTTQTTNTTNESSTATTTNESERTGAPDGNGTPPTPPSGVAPSDMGDGNRRSGQGGGTMTPGVAGITRLFQKGLGEQVSWFLGLAVSGFMLVLFSKKKPARKARKNIKGEVASSDIEILEAENKVINRWSKVALNKQHAILWMLWLLPASIYFSFSTGLFHTYYLAMLAAPIAALCAIGLSVIFIADPEKRPWIKWVGLLAIVGNSFLQSLYHSYYGDWEGWMVVLIPLITITGVVGYIISIKLKKQTIMKWIATVIIISGITIGPFAWSLTPMLYGVNSTLAQATPSTSLAQESQNNVSKSTTQLAAYLLENQGSATYLVAAQSSQEVSSIIIETGKPALAIGGFSGSDSTMTLDAFKELVKTGQLQYYLGGQSRGNDEILTWVKENSTIVSSSEYGSGTTNQATQSEEQRGGMNQSSTLYKINGSNIQ